MGQFPASARNAGPRRDRLLGGRFAQAFPGTAHLALGIDEPRSDTEPDPAELRRYGLALSREVVLTGVRVPVAPRPNTGAYFRILRSDTDWDSVFELRTAIDGSPAEEQRQFLRQRVAAHRRLASDGTAAWFGAFEGDQLIASLGIAMTGQGVARYQNVGTHPGHRRRGLAATLVARAGEYALTNLGARSLVIVAEAESAALRIYRSLGFTAAEVQVGIERSE